MSGACATSSFADPSPFLSAFSAVKFPFYAQDGTIQEFQKSSRINGKPNYDK
jgi:hypothetical protein